MNSGIRPPAGYGPMTAVVVLTLATALIHLSLGTTLFVLNGLGYIVLLVLLYAPVRQLAAGRHIVRYVLIAYTAITIILWFPLGTPYTGIGYLTKLIELLLIVALIVEASLARRSVRPSSA